MGPWPYLATSRQGLARRLFRPLLGLILPSHLGPAGLPAQSLAESSLQSQGSPLTGTGRLLGQVYLISRLSVGLSLGGVESLGNLFCAATPFS